MAMVLRTVPDRQGPSGCGSNDDPRVDHCNCLCLCAELVEPSQDCGICILPRTIRGKQLICCQIREAFQQNCTALWRPLLDALGISPSISAGLRLGEGTGAIAMLPLLDMAAAVYCGMRTFEQIQIDAELYSPLAIEALQSRYTVPPSRTPFSGGQPGAF